MQIMETEIFIELMIEGDQDKINHYCQSKNDWSENIDCKIVIERIKNVENSAVYNFLGHMYCKDEDKNKAFNYAKMSAKCNDRIGQHNLGKCYLDMKKYEKAFKYFQLSAEQNYYCAINDVGYMYNNGYGVQKNNEKAFYHYRLAAKRNDEIGQHNLGLMYMKGEGIKRNNEKAIKYLCLSYLGGHVESKLKIKYLLSNIYNIENYIFTIIEKNNSLEEENKCIEMENIELKYRPRNIGYYEARDHFCKIKY
jgi:TPR repeat protein